MSEEINYNERYDELLNIQPSYGVDRIKKPVKYNYIGLEIEISVNYERERYTFIRTLLKKIKNLIGENGYFVKDGTILGNYSFEIVLDPMPATKIRKVYATLMKIIKFSDGSIHFDAEHNCGLHMNFNQYDVVNIKEAHQRLLLLINQKSKYFEENVYKRTIYNFNFEDYLEYQKTVSDKYTGINYLNKKLIEVRNIKAGLTPKSLELIMADIVNALYPEKTFTIKETKHVKKIKTILSDIFESNNKKLIKKSFDENYLIIKFEHNKAILIEPTEEVKNFLNKRSDNE